MKTHHITSITLMSAMLVAGSASAAQQPQNTSAPATPRTTTAQAADRNAAQPAPADRARTQEQQNAPGTTVDNPAALGMLAAINEHEIKAAEQALSKKVSGPVAEYAQMMKREHSANQTKTRALGANEDGREVQGQKAKGRAELTELGKKSGTEYEKAYIDAMVRGHTEALGKIDGPLIKMSSGPARDHLAKTREHVAKHLEAAKKLQNR
jgi:putative membrane protein